MLCLAFSPPLPAAEAPAALQRALPTAHIGTVLPTAGLSPNALPTHYVTRSWSGGTLVFSDSPEYVPGPGVLYADTLPAGPVRLMLYHVNDSAAAGSPRTLQFAVIVEPAIPGAAVTIRMRRKVVNGPSTDYGRVGRVSAYAVLAQAESPETRVLNGPALLDPDLRSRPVPSGATPPLLEAHYDFDIEGGPARVTIAALRSTADVLATFRTLPVLAREQSSPGVYNHDRGTYPGQAGKDVVSTVPYDTVSGLAHVRFGNGSFDPWDSRSENWDPWAGQGATPTTFTGTDALLGIPSTLRGNYGVVYRVRLRLASSDGRRVGIVMVCTGGYHAGAARISPSLAGEGAFYAPALTHPAMAPFTEGAVLGRWNPAVTPEITLEWVPPGAFSLPVEWVLVPYPEPGDADGSGVVNLADAALIARHLNGLHSMSGKQAIAADITGDGAVTVADAASVLRKAAGLR